MAETSISGQAGRPDGVRQIATPRAVRALSTLSRIDYEDAFLVDVGPVQERTAEQWSRAVLEDAPVGVRCMLRSGWSAIGLKLDGAPSDRLVLGWEIRRSTPELVLLGAGSCIGLAGELLFKRHGRNLLFATFVRQDNVMARTVWAGVEPAHVRIVPSILEQARQRVGGPVQASSTGT